MTLPEALALVRRTTGRPVALPSGASVELQDRGAAGLDLVVELPAAALAKNLQDNLPASPFFALGLAAWMERLTGHSARVTLRLTGALPPPDRHTRRASLLLLDLAALMPHRLTVEPDLSASTLGQWPQRPVLNAPMQVRALTHQHDPDSEHALEVEMAASARLARSFPEPILRLERQLPIGLFDGVVSRDTAWSPTGSSQVDLWGRSPDGLTWHLIELKRAGNVMVGILPEALWYLRVLGRFRAGTIGGGGPELQGLRGATRLVMWLATPDLHPLLTGGVLDWLNVGLKPEHQEIRVLPWSRGADGELCWGDRNTT